MSVQQTDLAGHLNTHHTTHHLKTNCSEALIGEVVTDITEEDKVGETTARVIDVFAHFHQDLAPEP